MDGGAEEIVAPPETKAEVKAEEKAASTEETKNEPENGANTSENTQIPEVFASPEVSPMLDIEHYKKRGSRARKRKYEKTGIHGDIPVKDVVLFRYKMKRHIPDLSDDMEHWYEYWYFTKPNRAKDGDKYEQHVKSWERGRKWIAEECGIEALGDSRKIVAIRKRSNS